MLGLIFSATRPADPQLDDQPLANFAIEAITRAQRANQLPKSARPRELAVIFLTGLFALLTMGAPPSKARRLLVDTYVKTIVSGMKTP
jgi:hypothetical protein